MDLGLSCDELLRMEPSQFYVMVEYHKRRRRQSDLMLAQIAAAVVNSGFARPEKGVLAEDFLLREIADEPEPSPPVRQSAEQVADALRAIMAQYNPQPA